MHTNKLLHTIACITIGTSSNLPGVYLSDDLSAGLRKKLQANLALIFRGN